MQTRWIGRAILALLTAPAGAWAQTAPQSSAPGTPPASTPNPARAEPLLKSPDWPNLGRYRAENAALPARAPGEKRVVFLGDSITDNWGRSKGSGDFFPGKPYINRGISGQTTPQMLVRFEQDVVHLHPAVVVILAGTNDVVGNTGPSTPEMTEDNLAAMAAVAKANRIAIVMASITPVFRYPWKPEIEAVAPIQAINQWMRHFCEQTGCTYLDYYSAMADDKGAMRPGLSSDGVHPVAKGYSIMGPLAESAIARALRR